MTVYRRLSGTDAAEYQALRMEGFARHPLEFRIAPEDEADLSPDAVAKRLAESCVIGAFRDDVLIGIGGLTRDPRVKLRHKALLWGMYIRENARGAGAADGIMERLIEHARAAGVSIVQLTVMADNPRARRVYERWGFRVYGIEPRAVRVEGRDHDEALMSCEL